MMSVPWRSCLQLSHRRPPKMCGLQTRPRTDVDPPPFLPPSNCHRRGGGYRLAVPVDTLSLGRIALMRLVATHVALGVVCVSVCWAYRRAVQNK